MGNKRTVYRLAIVIGLVIATIGAYAWSASGTRTASSDALRYDGDRGCMLRPLSAARRAAASGSLCRVERLAVDRRDVEASAAASAPAGAPAAAKPSGYVVTFASGPSRMRAVLAAVPAQGLWESVEPGRELDVQFFQEKISGFELGGRFVATIGDPSVETSEHSVGTAFIPLAFLYLFGVIAFFALGPPGGPAPKPGARKGGRPGAKQAPRPNPKAAPKAAKR